MIESGLGTRNVMNGSLGDKMILACVLADGLNRIHKNLQLLKPLPNPLQIELRCPKGFFLL
jgi:hypothetical protein